MHEGRGLSFFANATIILALVIITVPGNFVPSPEKYKGTMFLTDEPGNWFKNDDTGTPVSVVNVGDRIQFDRNTQTGTKHTVTLLIKPTGSNLEVDQDHAGNGKVEARFDRPGVFLFICKVHPYMTGVVAVKDAQGAIPDVTAQELPFIGHLGLASLPATTVLDVLTTIAPDDDAKAAKWDLIVPANQTIPATPGVGEVWIDTQFEHVPGQADRKGFLKPGTITVVNVDNFTAQAPFTVEREINGLAVRPGDWNNPHNMWTNTALSTVYNTNWFSQTINKIDRATGTILNTIVTGQAPTHIVTIPNEASAQFGILTNPLSAENDIVKVRDEAARLKVVDHFPTGVGRNHPHGHWITSNGTRIVVPNVFKGFGVTGSISILDAENGAILREISHRTLGLESALLMPIAAGIQSNAKAYVSNAASGEVSVIDLPTMQIIKNIPVTIKPNGEVGGTIFDTLQVPIQPPVSPDDRFVGVAVLSLTTVGRDPTGSPDHVAIIDTFTDEVVAFLGTVATPGRGAGTHGANWGAKLGGGYYLHVANQFANFLTVIDPDPNGDGSAPPAVVGRILLANGSAGAGKTDGVGGQGIKPLPNMYNGWIQDTVALSETGQLSAEVQGWIDQLTGAQRNPAQ
ncbi:MAG: hypothetical protein HYX84_00015 [Chloroflexi bacterium]|nr:hypothetical protein [Chloroflexota bacterium]